MKFPLSPIGFFDQFVFHIDARQSRVLVSYRNWVVGELLFWKSAIIAGLSQQPIIVVEHNFFPPWLKPIGTVLWPIDLAFFVFVVDDFIA